jgi:hypothetical protein
LIVEKLTVPTPLEGVTTTVKLTLVPGVTLVAEGVMVMELVVREVAQAVARFFTSREPRPVTRL